ncbi:MAG: hypothetical protein KME16_28250 [Scytolyngbya sp. HA4215-MV1]|jgi:hypothetical protein|nr:hypothetical protein [Scytolyngbya sp. HA4215-MV1]
MKRKIKNNKEEYISRSSLHHSKDGQKQDEESIEAKAANPERYSQAVIEENWYINFNAIDKKS